MGDSAGSQSEAAAVLLSSVSMGAAGPRPLRPPLRGHGGLHTPRLVVEVLPGVDPRLRGPVDFICLNLKLCCLMCDHDNSIDWLISTNI